MIVKPLGTEHYRVQLDIVRRLEDTAISMCIFLFDQHAFPQLCLFQGVLCLPGSVNLIPRTHLWAVTNMVKLMQKMCLPEPWWRWPTLGAASP